MDVLIKGLKGKGKIPVIKDSQLDNIRFSLLEGMKVVESPNKEIAFIYDENMCDVDRINKEKDSKTIIIINHIDYQRIININMIDKIIIQLKGDIESDINALKEIFINKCPQCRTIRKGVRNKVYPHLIKVKCPNPNCEFGVVQTYHEDDFKT
jgi:hypothetical protein